MAVTTMALLLNAGLLGSPAMAGESEPIVQHSKVFAFQAAGAVGGGVLVPGTMYLPNGGKGSSATLKRYADKITVNVQTTGLPAGAFTLWWVIWNYPDFCAMGGCGDPDLFNPEVQGLVVRATGGVVGRDGTAHFHDTLEVGDPGLVGRFVPFAGLDNPLANPLAAQVLAVIKYHGPASPDPVTLEMQTHTFFGGCFAGANAVHPFNDAVVWCFDPQAMLFPAP